MLYCMCHSNIIIIITTEYYYLFIRSPPNSHPHACICKCMHITMLIIWQKIFSHTQGCTSGCSSSRVQNCVRRRAPRSNIGITSRRTPIGVYFWILTGNHSSVTEVDRLLSQKRRVTASFAQWARESLRLNLSAYL